MPVSARNRFLTEFPQDLLNDAATVFIGAGVSMSAGYPSWVKLLKEIGEELGVESDNVSDLAALAQWSIQENGSANRVRTVIRNEISPNKDIPRTLEIISRLPIRNIWTTNYDRLIERSFENVRRPLDVVSSGEDLAIRARPGASKLYKMHGSIERLDDIVISTDDYELYRSTRGAFLPLLQAHLTGTSMLFVGLSFTDQNVRHVLSLIRESFSKSPPEHFAIVRPPQKEDFKSNEEFRAKKTQHDLWAKDLRRYGLLAIEIENYDEVPDLLGEIERRVALKRIWVSGSWPTELASSNTAKVYNIAHQVGRLVGDQGLSLVSGSGVLVSSAAISGLLDSLRADGSWDLERRLIARPFPQPLAKDDASGHEDRAWSELRHDMAKLSGIIVLIGGAKLDGDEIIAASGVEIEAEIAAENGTFLLPIGATGGAAEKIAADLIGSKFPFEGRGAIRPTDDELATLLDKNLEIGLLVSVVAKIISRLTALEK